MAIACGGIGFLLLPAEPAYPPPGALGPWAGLFLWADRCNLTYNMVPSLHVALAVCCVSAMAPYGTWPVRAMLWIWAGLIALSTLLTHQHHLLDVLTGWAVGLASYRFLPIQKPAEKNAGPLIE